MRSEAFGTWTYGDIHRMDGLIGSLDWDCVLDGRIRAITHTHPPKKSQTKSAIS